LPNSGSIFFKKDHNLVQGNRLKILRLTINGCLPILNDSAFATAIASFQLLTEGNSCGKKSL
jgi:hypothetical protein